MLGGPLGRAFDVSADGSLSNQRLVYDFAPGRGGDGMRLDLEGNLYVAAGVLQPRHACETGDVPTGIYVITPAGELLGRQLVPHDFLIRQGDAHLVAVPVVPLVPVVPVVHPRLGSGHLGRGDRGGHPDR